MIENDNNNKRTVFKITLEKHQGIKFKIFYLKQSLISIYFNDIFFRFYLVIFSQYFFTVTTTVAYTGYIR